MPKLSNQEKARRAREGVAEELCRRGAVDVAESQEGNVFEILASDIARTRRVTLRVKTKSSGDWQTTTTLGEERREDPAERHFWILVDSGVPAGAPHGYFVVPDWWMCNYVLKEFQAHLDAHGGERPITPTSTHCAVHPWHVEEWRDRWDLLGIF